MVYNQIVLYICKIKISFVAPRGLIWKSTRENATPTPKISWNGKNQIFNKKHEFYQYLSC